MKYLRHSSLALGLMLLVLLTIVQQLPDVLDSFLAHPTKFSELSNSVYSLKINSLQSGEYYISLGRPRHFCDIYHNNELIFKGKTTIHDIRPSLLVGAGFKHHQGELSLLSDCKQYMSGFQQRLSFPPRLYSYKAGIVVHYVRAFIDMAAGPISCLFMLAAAMMNLFFSRDTATKAKSYVFIIFSAVALAYSLSLAHYSRLIMSGMAASQVHIILRTIFSIGMAALLHPKHFPGYFLTGLHIIVCTLVLFLPYSNVQIETFYLFSFLLYPTTTFFTLWISKKSDDHTHDSFFLEALLLSWGVAQVMDWVKQLSGIGYFAAPLYLGAISIYLTYRVVHQQSLLLKASALSKTIESFINSSLSPSDLVKELGIIIHAHSCYGICSIYVSATFIGSSNDERRLVKVASIGKNISPDSVDLDPVDAPVLTQAITDQFVAEGLGRRDGFRYLVVPLGRYAVICLSADKKIAKNSAGETKQLISLLTSSLELVKEKLSRSVSLTGSSLNKLRASYGDGTYKKTIGAIFIDIAEYSKKTEEFGEAYASFVSSELLPDLIKTLKDTALPEVVRGDEILFIVCDETPAVARDIPRDTSIAIQKLYMFMTTTAQHQSNQSGFGKVEFRIGFTIGSGAIVIDDVQARTSGDHINKAKRLQDIAAKGELYTDSETIALIGNSCLLPLSRVSLVVKKNVIEAVKVGVKRAA